MGVHPQQDEFTATHNELTISGYKHSITFDHSDVTAAFGDASVSVNYDALKKGTFNDLTISITLGEKKTELPFGGTLKRKVVVTGPPIEMDFIASLSDTFDVPRE